MGHKMWAIFAKREKTGQGLSDQKPFPILCYSNTNAAHGGSCTVSLLLCNAMPLIPQFPWKLSTKSIAQWIWLQCGFFLYHFQTVRKAGRWCKHLAALKPWTAGTRQIYFLKVNLNVSFLIKCPQWFYDTVASLFCVIMKYQQCHFISIWLFEGKKII